jgi:SNF2 family DNA or RNA helicase
MMQAIVSHKHKLVGVPVTTQVTGLYPQAPKHKFGNEEYTLLPHTETETFMLRKLGFDVPAPVLTQYDFPNPVDKPAFDVQKKTVALLTMAERAYVLNGMGTGKTKCALWAWDYLRLRKRAKKMLVVCPRSTMNFTWVREIFETLPSVKASILHGSKAKRLERLADMDTDIYIINHDGIKVIEKELLARDDIDTVCIDELAKFRNKSERTKVMVKIAKGKTWAWGMTGSPMPHSPTDVFWQCKVITPGTVPNYYSHFENELMLKLQNGAFVKLLPKNDAVERAYSVMQPAVRFTIDEVVELPECITRFVDVELGPKQGKVYKDIVRHCQATLQGNLVTAANAGAAMSKLMQISLGWVYTQSGILPLDNELRIEALMDAIDSTDRKVIVFVPFKHALKGISDALTHEGIEHAEVSGDTTDSERNRIFNLFQNTEKYQVLVAHPECLAHGITLTAADTIIWFGPITSNETYIQANARISRVGQKHKQQVIHLQSTAVERKIYRMLTTQQNVQESFLKMFADNNEEW